MRSLLLTPGRLELENISSPPPVPPRSALIRVSAALIDGAELLALQGVLWRRRVVAGFSGYGRVVKLGLGASGVYEGDVVTLGCPEKVPVAEGDGWAAEYAVMDSRGLHRLGGRVGVEAALAYPAGIGPVALGDAVDACILGCGVSGLAAAIYAEERGIDYRLYCLSEWGARSAQRLGLRYSKPPERAECRRLFLAAYSGRALLAAEKWRFETLVLHPVYASLDPPRVTGAMVRVEKCSDVPRGLSLARVLLEEGVVRLVEGLELGAWSGEPVILVLRSSS